MYNYLYNAYIIYSMYYYCIVFYIDIIMATKNFKLKTELDCLKKHLASVV